MTTDEISSAVNREFGIANRKAAAWHELVERRGLVYSILASYPGSPEFTSQSRDRLYWQIFQHHQYFSKKNAEIVF
jgi:hypothetical protein